MGPRNSIPMAPRAISRGRSGDLMEPQARGESRSRNSEIRSARKEDRSLIVGLDAAAGSQAVLATSSCFIYSTYPRVGFYGEGKRRREAPAIPRVYNATTFYAD